MGVLLTILGFVLYGSLVLPAPLRRRFGYPSLQAGEAMAYAGWDPYYVYRMLLASMIIESHIAGVFIAALTLGNSQVSI